MELIDLHDGKARRTGPRLAPLATMIALALGLGATPAVGQAQAAATGAIVVATPSAVDFGDVATGKTRTRKVTLRNEGDAAAVWVSFEYQGSKRFSHQDKIGLRSGSPLGSDKQIDFMVEFAPKADGRRSATLVITFENNDDADDSVASVSIDLTGRGLTTEPELVAQPSSIDLGTIPKNKFVRPSFDVKNVSEATVNMRGVSVTVSTFALGGVNNDCDTIALQPGQTCSVELWGWTPTSSGGFEILVALPSDDPHSPLRVRIKGRTPAPPPDTVPPEVSLAPFMRVMKQAYRKGSRKARYNWGWTGRDDSGKIAGFRTQRRVGHGPWKTVSKPSRSVDRFGHQRVNLLMPTQKPVRFRTRALDEAGNRSPWATSAPHTVSYRNIRKGKSALTGKWQNVNDVSGAYGNDLVKTRHNGAAASITATARGIALVVRTVPRGGSVLIADGSEGYSKVGLDSKKRKDLVVLYSWWWPDVAKRTITVNTSTIWPDRAWVMLDSWVVVK